ncbi:hypothetical protein ACNI65_06960 [Roseateles sp. So40a]|uniref:hypothetical protein n=1 Tax=Roseateles sp. So40a TaxID=3400226 RepID=UPI003A879BCD
MLDMIPAWRIALAVCLTIPANAVHATDRCDDLLDRESPAFAKQTPKEFDLTPGQGWRLLATEGCKAQAAVAIQRFLSEGDRPYHVYFHGAQMDATVGNYPAALEKLQRARRPEMAADSPFKWNDYVDAVAAFLRRDLDSLRRCRQEIAQRADVPGNAANLKVVDQLIDHFGKPYGEIFR